MTAEIIVGFDATPSSVEAVMWAANEAVARRRTLRIVTCVEMPMFVGDPMLGYPAAEAFTSLQATADSEAAAMVDTVTATYPELTVTTSTSADRAGGVLLHDLTTDDLVVVGASRHDGLSALMLGSTTRHVVHHSPCPVAVIRGATSRGRPDRIVVGVDGSPVSDDVVRWAGDEATLHNIELVVVHGWSYPYAPDDTRSVQARELTEIDAACMLERSVELARARTGVDVIGHLVEASAVSALLESTRDGDVLVIGSRGRGALRSRLFGSTVNAVLEACVAPVIVVRGVVDGPQEPTPTADRRAVGSTSTTVELSDLQTVG